MFVAAAAQAGFTVRVDGYSSGVLQSLVAVRDLFGAPAAPSVSVASTPVPAGSTPWSGRAAEGERTQTTALTQTRERFAGADRGVDAWAQRTAQDTAAGRGSAAALVSSAQSTANALAPYSHTPAGRAALMSAMSDHASQGARLVAEHGSTIPARRAELANLLGQYGQPESSGDTRALGFGPDDAPLAPATDEGDDGEDPPHGEDPRFWLDVTEIEHVPTGTLAPHGYMQIGPELWYPDPNRYDVTPPPPPAKYPLDVGDVMVIQDGELFPNRYREIAPNIGVPEPGGLVPSRPWGPPQQPIDIRDVIEVPSGTLAPPNYVEYFPGWWVPDYSPQPR